MTSESSPPTPSVSADSATTPARDPSRPGLDVVAIDGPSGAGKSTVSRRVAERLGWRFLDTGAMYRAVTLVLLDAGLLADAESIDEAAVERALATVRLDMPAAGGVVLDGRDVADAIREPRVESEVGRVARLAPVRERMRGLQRAIAETGPLVAEGRDMTTVVFPNARHRFFLDASVDERARRRHADFVGRGRDVTLEVVRTEIEQRDHGDRTREDGPLVRGDGVDVIGSDGLSSDQVVDRIVERVRVAATPKRTTKGPRSEWFYTFCRELCMATMRTLFGLRRNGSDRERLPAQGGVLMVANHSSYLDPVLVGCVAKRPLCYLARSTLGSIPVFGSMLRSYGVRFIDRNSPARGDLQRAIDLLQSGEALLIFPEGSRSLDGSVGEFKRGVLTIAKRAGVPVMPVGIEGSFRAYPRGKVLPRPTRCRVRFGTVRPAAAVLAPGGLEALRREIGELARTPVAAPDDNSDNDEAPPGAASRSTRSEQGVPVGSFPESHGLASDVVVDAGAPSRRAR